MAVHAYSQLKNPASFEYAIRKVSMKEETQVDMLQRAMLAKLQEGVCYFFFLSFVEAISYEL